MSYDDILEAKRRLVLLEITLLESKLLYVR